MESAIGGLSSLACKVFNFTDLRISCQVTISFQAEIVARIRVQYSQTMMGLIYHRDWVPRTKLCQPVPEWLTS